MDYVTIASEGNATDFGDIGSADHASGASNQVRGIFMTGSTLHYINIATTGNSTSFGNLTGGRVLAAALSNGHGGL
jgi:hypothetical protein